MTKREAGRDEADAYRRVADSCRKQALDVAKSGWGFFSRRCAILNLEGIADLCEAWAELAETKARSAAGEAK